MLKPDPTRSTVQGKTQETPQSPSVQGKTQETPQPHSPPQKPPEAARQPEPIDPKSKIIYSKLDQPVSMSFGADDIPLSDLVLYLREMTIDPGAGLPKGIPIHVDPVGLRNAGRTVDDKISMNLEGIPLRATLQLALDQLKLTYTVKDGVLKITCPSDTPEPAREPELVDERSKIIHSKLEEPLEMFFKLDTPLSDLLKYIKQATIDEKAGLPTGIPIYVDPAGLKDVEKTMAGSITINVEDVPLKASLQLVLDQLDLTYTVKGGILMITSKPIESRPK